MHRSSRVELAPDPLINLEMKENEHRFSHLESRRRYIAPAVVICCLFEKKSTCVPRYYCCVITLVCFRTCGESLNQSPGRDMNYY